MVFSSTDKKGTNFGGEIGSSEGTGSSLRSPLSEISNVCTNGVSKRTSQFTLNRNVVYTKIDEEGMTHSVNQAAGSSLRSPLSEINNVCTNGVSKKTSHFTLSRNVVYKNIDDEGITPSVSEVIDLTSDCEMESCAPAFPASTLIHAQNGTGNSDQVFINQELQITKKAAKKPRVRKAHNDHAAPVDYWDIGDMTYNCEHCGAMFWFDERLSLYPKSVYPKYSLCCTSGKIQLPLLEPPPPLLRELVYGTSSKSKHYVENIRSYNNMFSFTSMGGKIDKTMNTGSGPPVFQLHGQNYHLIGSLLPSEGSTPKFAQLYIYDTENEIQNRISAVRKNSEINTLHSELVVDLKAMLDKNNVLVKSFRMAGKRMEEENRVDVRIKLCSERKHDKMRYNMPAVSEVAALVVGDFDQALGNRDIIVESRSGTLKRINEMHASYLALQYPLLFPYGEDGYSENIPLAEGRESVGGGRKKVSMREFAVFRLQERENERTIILYSRRLTQQVVVDIYTIIESIRLLFIRLNQKTLRVELYSGLSDALIRGDTDLSRMGLRVVLPSSYTGGPHYLIQAYQDAMAICRWADYLDLFITFTCNPKWPEIVRFLEPRGLKPEDRPDIVVRIFKVKLDGLINEVRTRKVFGSVIAVVYTIEFQKRGLPHAHILLFLSKADKYPTGQDIDRIISAEIPDEVSNPKYYAVVQEFMIHGPCGSARPNSPCMDDDGKCSKHFPKRFVESTTIDDDGYPVYRRRDDGRTIIKSGAPLNNHYVVPHNRYLLLKYGAHINVEWCNQSRSIKYLFKYINKGHDRVTAGFYKASSGDASEQPIDEISMNCDCRYISSCEAAWRIYGFEIQYKNPPVERLSFHLENQQSVVFSGNDPLENVLERQTISQSMFLGWFEANKKYPQANNLTYVEFPQHFVWKKKTREWVPRERGLALARLHYVPPGCGDPYYARCLLNIVKGCRCYDDIKKVETVQYDTYRDACYARGLLEDDREYIDGIEEASHWASAQHLRGLFVTLLFSNSIARPEKVWEQCWTHLSDDILYRQRALRKRPDLTLSDDDIKNLTLVEIEKLLRSRGKSLIDYEPMPTADFSSSSTSFNRFIAEELSYDREALAIEHEKLVGNMTEEQHNVYSTVMESLDSGNGGAFFVYGYGGTGKTFIWRTLSAALRSRGDIVLNVASSGIASLLLPGGRTAHSRFKIPLNVHEDSISSLTLGSPLAELIEKSKLIIWDEAPMMHKNCFETLDKLLQDIMKNEIIFGGKSVVLGGDFRQILPVVPKGTRQDIVFATINSSYLWRHFKVLTLTKDMRLQNIGSNSEGIELSQFAEWIQSIGDGTIGGPNDGEVEIAIPDDILLENSEDPIATIVRSTYPNFGQIGDDSEYLQGRAILAPTLNVVESVNEYMTNMNNSQGRTYLSSDTPCRSDANVDLLNDLHTPEFLNKIKCSGVPNHELNLKIGTPVMLLQNLDFSQGLCNGTRLILTKLGDHVLEGKILSGSNAGQKVPIPRLSVTPSDKRMPFKFQRRQFPFIVSYAMTINKSQGQSLNHVGLLLKKPVFCHGQLYVAVSRVTNRRGLKILISDEVDPHKKTTTNVVYKEVFQNL